MGLDQYAHLRNRKINWEKYYNDDKEEQKGVFVWRKHARLQVFMNQQWVKQNEHTFKNQLKDANNKPLDLSHLGFNAGEVVYMTEEVVKDLEEAIKMIITHILQVMDFSGDNNFKSTQ